MHTLTRTLAVATTAFFVAAGTATAHIQAYPTVNGEGSEAVVQFGIPHGCDDKGTTKLEINFPKEFISVRPISAGGWTGSGGSGHSHSMSMGDDHDSMDMEEGDDHGSMDMEDDGTTAADSGDDSMKMDEGDDSMKMDEGDDSMKMDEGDDSMKMEDDGTSTVVWTADSPASAGDFHVVSAWMVVPPDAKGKLWLPAIQTCEGGDTYEWTTKELGAELPAPYLEFDAASSSSAAADDGGDDDGDDTDTGPIAIVALVLGMLGTLLGIGAILRSRKD